MGNKGSSPKGKDRDAEEESQGGKTEATTKKPAKKNFIVQIQEGYAALCNAIIRPPRAEYDMRELGPNFSRYRTVDFNGPIFSLSTRGVLHFSAVTGNRARQAPQK